MPREVKDCLRWWSTVLTAVAPRLVLSLRYKEPSDPVRIYSGATGAFKVAIISVFPNGEGRRPCLLATQADADLENLASTSNKISIAELSESSASVVQIQSDSLRR